MATPIRSYISIARWPEGMDEAARASALAKAFSVDAYTAKELAKRQPPTILRRIEESQVAGTLAALEGAGIAAMATSIADIAARAMPPRAKSFDLAGGDPSKLVIELWHESEKRTVAFDDVVMLVRGTVHVPAGHHDADTAVAVSHMLQSSQSISDWDQGHSARARLKHVDLLDVYERGGKSFRIEAQRCNFDFLSAAKAATPAENLQLMQDSLRSRCPNARFDDHFGTARFLTAFVPDLAAHTKTKATHSGAGSDAKSLSAFQFYSAWVSLLVGGA